MNKRIWIDLENSPHVPLFAPIVEALRAEGYEVFLTARDFAQTRELLSTYGLSAVIIGGEYGSNALRKILGLTVRAWRLRTLVRKFRPQLFVSHGSRGGLLAASSLRVRTLTMYDYEGASVRFFNRLSDFVLTPDALTDELLSPLGLSPDKHLTYPGLKEEVYLCGDQALPDRPISDKITVGIRPPSDTAHYRADESRKLFEGVLELLKERDDVQVILVPRTKHQLQEMQALAEGTNFIVQDEPRSVRDFFASVDLFVGGGGTMNREAAVLGVPVATIFKGAMGAVDAALIREGRMVELKKASELTRMIRRQDRVIGCEESESLTSILNKIRTATASR